MDNITIARDCHTINAVQVNFKYLEHIFPNNYFFVVHGVDLYFKEFCSVHHLEYKWQYFVTVNDAFYMVPATDQDFVVRSITGFYDESTVSAHEAGVIATLNALNDLAKNSLFEADNISQKMESLLQYVQTRPYFETIQPFLAHSNH